MEDLTGSKPPDPLTVAEQVVPERTTVDGVPVFWLAVPGPMQAMLIFRVGVIDETLPTRGITHLVEHLAMFIPMQSSPLASHMNARVELHRTRFMASGTGDEIATFLSDVTSHIGALPLDRLEDEKKILRTEAANKTGGSAKSIWTYRFGSQGPGLADYQELGLRWLGRDAVADWAAANFTAGNAVLWLSGEPPEGLRLNLPPGPHRGVPAVAPLDFATPTFYQEGNRWVILSMLGARGVALSVGAQILDARVRDRLRIQQSLAYEVHANYTRLDNRVAEVTAFADSLANSAGAAAEALVSVTRALADDGPEPEELAAAVAQRRRAREDPNSGYGLLELAALQELDELAPVTAAEQDAEVEALTPAAVAEAFQSAVASSYLAVPTNVDVNVVGFTPIPLGNGRRFKGTEVLAMLGADHADVIDYSDEGISVTSPDGTTSIGMKWQDVAVGLWWKEGRRTLIGPDGLSINVDPAKWRKPEPLIKQLLASVPSDRWVSMDDAEPAPAPQAKVPKPAWMRQRSLRRWLLALLIIADVLGGIYALSGLLSLVTGETDTGTVVLFILFATIFTLTMAATIGVVAQTGRARTVSVIAGLAVSFTIVGAVLGIPIMVVAARLPIRGRKPSTN